MLLNVGAVIERSSVNGPGPRAVVWFQGCKKRCRGCANQQFLPESPATLMSPADLAARLLAIPDVEGVTYSGGEPFLQAEGVSVLSALLKEQGLSLVCYTGYRIEEIERSRNGAWHRLMGYLDILIDGEYEHDNRKPLLWRSSAGQRVHFLSDRYRRLAGTVDEPWEGFEAHLADGRIVLTGFIDETVERAILKDLVEESEMPPVEIDAAD